MAQNDSFLIYHLSSVIWMQIIVIFQNLSNCLQMNVCNCICNFSIHCYFLVHSSGDSKQRKEEIERWWFHPVSLIQIVIIIVFLFVCSFICKCFSFFRSFLLWKNGIQIIIIIRKKQSSNKISNTLNTKKKNFILMLVLMVVLLLLNNSENLQWINYT